MRQPPGWSQARSEHPPSMGSAEEPVGSGAAGHHHKHKPGAATRPVHPSLHPSPPVFIAFKWLSKPSVIYNDWRGTGRGDRAAPLARLPPRHNSRLHFNFIYLFIYFGANLRRQRSAQSLLTAPKSTSIILRPFGSGCHGDQKQNGMQINTSPGVQ